MAFNEAVSVKFGADVTDFQRNVDSMHGTVDRLAGGIEHKLIGTRHVIGALFAGFGLGGGLEGIAEKIAGVIMGGTKEGFKEAEKSAEEYGKVLERILEGHLGESALLNHLRKLKDEAESVAAAPKRDSPYFKKEAFVNKLGWFGAESPVEAQDRQTKAKIRAAEIADKIEKLEKDSGHRMAQMADEEHKRALIGLTDESKLVELKKEAEELERKAVSSRGKGDRDETFRLEMEQRKKQTEVRTQEQKISDEAKKSESERVKEIEKANAAMQELSDKHLSAQNLVAQKMREEVAARDELNQAMEDGLNKEAKALALMQAQAEVAAAKLSLEKQQTAIIDARETLATAKSNLGQAKKDFGLPSLSRLAGSTGPGSDMAKEAERFQEMAIARSGSAPQEAARFSERAAAIRESLGSRIKSADANPFRAMEKAVTDSEKHLSGILKNTNPIELK